MDIRYVIRPEGSECGSCSWVEEIKEDGCNGPCACRLLGIWLHSSGDVVYRDEACCAIEDAVKEYGAERS